LTNIIEQRAALRVIERLRQQSGVGAILGIEEERAARFLIFRSSSPLWREPLRTRVHEVLSGDELALADNAADFLRRVSGNSDIRDEIPRAELEPLALDKETIGWFWAACTRRRPNIRRGTSIRKLKAQLEQKLAPRFRNRNGGRKWSSNSGRSVSLTNP
jgi:hypothetical protein